MKTAAYNNLSSDEMVTLLQGKDQMIAHLQEQLNLLTQKRYGRSSEKDINPNQLTLQFDEAEQALADDVETDAETETVTVPAHTRKKRGRVKLPEHLPRVDVIHDLSEDEKACTHDGHTLHEIGEETSEQLEIIPAQVRVIRHRRKKYACRHCEQGVVTAPAPNQPIPKSIASPALPAHVTVAKYQDALPLYRQESILARSGIELPRATLANWMVKMGELVTPLINRLRDHLLESPLIYMDETTVQVLKPDKGEAKPGKKSYMWVQVSGDTDKPVRLFDYDPSRSQQVPLRLLEGYQGLLVTDGYEGYNTITQQSGVTAIACWAHVRRKFNDALKAQKNRTGKAQVAMNLIKKLYTIEKSIKGLSPATQPTYFGRNPHLGREILWPGVAQIPYRKGAILYAKALAQAQRLRQNPSWCYR